MYLPVQTSAATRWHVWDYVTREVRSSLPAAGGICSALLPAVPDNELWFLDRLLVQCDSASATVAYVYLDQAADENVIDGTFSGNFDVADYAAPHAIERTRQLLVQWQGAAVGAVGRFRAQYTVMRLADGVS